MQSSVSAIWAVCGRLTLRLTCDGGAPPPSPMVAPLDARRAYRGDATRLVGSSSYGMQFQGTFVSSLSGSI